MSHGDSPNISLPALSWGLIPPGKDKQFPLHGEVPGRDGKPPLSPKTLSGKIKKRNKKPQKTKHRAVRAVNRFSVSFPWHLPPWPGAQPEHAGVLGWPRQPRLFLGTQRQSDAGRGPRTPPSRDTLGCLFMGADDFVESQTGTGKRPALHHQPEGGLRLCHPEKNSTEENSKPWQGAGSIFPSPSGAL